MKNEFKNVLLAGVGAAAHSYEKASELVDEFVEKGKLTVNEGKELTEELKKTIKEKTESSKSCSENTEKPLTKSDMLELFKSMNLATKADVDALNQRITKLEDSNK